MSRFSGYKFIWFAIFRDGRGKKDVSPKNQKTVLNMKLHQLFFAQFKSNASRNGIKIPTVSGRMQVVEKQIGAYLPFGK